ncbi:DUF378 domain-containing protein [Candidatus Saccharibacteria bacterium]|nr:DUF378 domain-containing protein [Candidatus Saccharibacteria bacterium]
MSFWDKASKLLLLAGGLNWGLIAFFDYNLVTDLFGSSEDTVRIIYGAIGLAAVWLAYRMLAWRAGPPKKKRR